MSQDPETQTVIHAAIQAARKDLKRGDPIAAQRHLDIAIQYEAPPSQTQPLATAIQRLRMAQQPRRGSGGGSGGWRGFWVALLGYIGVSLQQPLGWGMVLWGFLAFLLVPSLAGFVIGRYQRRTGTPGGSFWTALKSVGKAMGFYTALHLILIGGPHSDSANTGQEFLAGLLTTLLFALLAGMAAGAVSAAIVGMSAKEQQA